MQELPALDKPCEVEHRQHLRVLTAAALEVALAAQRLRRYLVRPFVATETPEAEHVIDNETGRNVAVVDRDQARVAARLGLLTRPLRSMFCCRSVALSWDT